MFAGCVAYVIAAVFLPRAALLLTSFQRFATVVLSQSDPCQLRDCVRL